RDWSSDVCSSDLSASSAEVFSMPCCVLIWKFTHMRSLLALIMLYVCLPNPCIWRKDLAIPRSLMMIVTWCRASGKLDQKSHLLLSERIFVLGSRLTAWFKSGK